MVYVSGATVLNPVALTGGRMVHRKVSQNWQKLGSARRFWRSIKDARGASLEFVSCSMKCLDRVLLGVFETRYEGKKLDEAHYL